MILPKSEVFQKILGYIGISEVRCGIEINNLGIKEIL